MCVSRGGQRSRGDPVLGFRRHKDGQTQVLGADHLTDK